MQPRRHTTGNSKPAQRISRPRNPKLRNYGSGKGMDFVRCHICGKHLRLITSTHLATHGTDRETYMKEYRLSPDKLCSKSFRVNHSSRRDYLPHGKRQWLLRLKPSINATAKSMPDICKTTIRVFTTKGFGSVADWDNALCAAGFTPENMRLWA